MSTTTSNLGLFKYTEADHNKAFDYKEALNQNWDIIDEVLQEVENTYVPKTTTINNKALSSNISLTPSDVGAAASSHNQASNTINAMTGYSKPSSTSAIAATDSLNTAIGKLEKALDGKASSDTNVTNTLNNTVKAYITGTTSNVTNTGTQVFDSNVYLSATAGELVATKFTGSLTGNVTGNCSGSSGSCTGNAATATKATQDSDGNQINTTYVKLGNVNQTVAGTKTFSGTITSSNNASINFTSTDPTIRKNNVNIFRNNSAGGTIISNAVTSGQDLILRPQGDGISTTQVNVHPDGSLGLMQDSVKLAYNSTTQALEFNFA